MKDPGPTLVLVPIIPNSPVSFPRPGGPHPGGKPVVPDDVDPIPGPIPGDGDTPSIPVILPGTCVKQTIIDSVTVNVVTSDHTAEEQDILFDENGNRLHNGVSWFGLAFTPFTFKRYRITTTVVKHVEITCMVSDKGVVNKVTKTYDSKTNTTTKNLYKYSGTSAFINGVFEVTAITGGVYIGTDGSFGFVNAYEPIVDGSSTSYEDIHYVEGSEEVAEFSKEDPVTTSSTELSPTQMLTLGLDQSDTLVRIREALKRAGVAELGGGSGWDLGSTAMTTAQLLQVLSNLYTTTADKDDKQSIRDAYQQVQLYGDNAVWGIQWDPGVENIDIEAW